MQRLVKVEAGVRYPYLIYTKDEHKIDLNRIDIDAKNAVHKIHRAGGVAYIVGGSLRDLLLGKTPKDFDVVTNLTPNQIRRLFSNARIIGKRFKLVLLLYKNGKEIEVATFRAISSTSYDNQKYGGIASDSCRRDFGVNALYYDPITEKILDFHNSYQDIKNKVLHPIISLDTIFMEDPIRLIRAIKYSVKDELKIELKLRHKIQKSGYLLGTVSTSRMADELIKIFQSTICTDIFLCMKKYDLLKFAFPFLDSIISKQNTIENLRNFDNMVLNFNLDNDKIISYAIYSIIKNNKEYKRIPKEYKINTKTKEGKVEFNSYIEEIKKDFTYLNFSNIQYFNALCLYSGLNLVKH